MQHQAHNNWIYRQGGLPQQRVPGRGTRWLYVASCAFCTAAFVTGLSFLFALHLGLEALALYHPHLPQESLMRASIAQVKMSQVHGRMMAMPVKAAQVQLPGKATYLPIDPTRYHQGPELPAEKAQPLPSQHAQHDSSSMTAGAGILTPADIVAAIVTSKANEGIARTGRLWRQGLKAFMASNKSLSQGQLAEAEAAGETWGIYPDDRPLHTLALQGDSRAALAPFLAHRHYGDTYKWLFYGDDDTVFFLDAAVNVLQHLDPDLPYFLTDHLWWTTREYDASALARQIRAPANFDTRHPHPAAPVCVPCNYAGDTSGLPWPAPVGCPCTPALLCGADKHGALFKGPRGQCGMPRVPTHTYSVHGGAGAVLSVGLLRRIPLEWFEDCVTKTYSTGGDALISICLWQAGYAITAPDPLWHPDNQSTMFDVGPVAQRDDEDIRPRIARVLDNLLEAAAGGCAPGSTCQLEMSHFLTLHLRSRKFPSTAAYTQTLRVLTALYDRAHGRPAAAYPVPEDLFIDQLVELGVQVKAQQLQLRMGQALQQEASVQQARPQSVEAWLRQAEQRAADDFALDILNAIFDRHAVATA